MNVIQRYTPRNDSNDDGKDQFCLRRQSIIEKSPEKDLTVLTEDLDGQIGIDNTGYDDVMGRHRLTILANTEFKLTLIKEERTTTKNNCKAIKETLNSTYLEVLDRKKHHHKKWISIETLNRMKESKNKKAAINSS
ncbi:unnamed protein product [Schistosoma margrebowiei]|uniref:Uncharacterized protein n=1 Tax=Schistosoma margrebowiei TaxID=48269 RepID=A0A183MQR8_9TREM|nr:unnamed protein product [Schistosoma margrebowiei]